MQEFRHLWYKLPAMGVFARRLLGQLIAAAAVIVMSIAGDGRGAWLQPASAGQAGGELAYAGRISFAEHHVDASGGHAAVTVTWRLDRLEP